ncbi:23S rRNA (guanosine(2251)-2'-O)-methyltransferase RlmB [Moraxella nasovis]|uniref:23S rRNA (guanosine(2251)-2'-O)-methyltransferase RlmB n=1 Tax=Moraxella nasovis TaxID=2904121 RepID=UPI001F611715|nr:23S rRNA (guanosine(2251)-2'-O)-methyltransferase RlmB [Moraxella nasovis]UNU72522.1 23S rRNA (guanosine(2251)-2'-O)-methyltransferase RlmB [Moraxella nasovis]
MKNRQRKPTNKAPHHNPKSINTRPQKAKKTTPNFYGTHAVKAILQNRPEDALALFVQNYDNNSNNNHDAIIALAKSVGVSVQIAQKDSLTELCGSTQHQGVVLSARMQAMADEALLDDMMDADDALFLVLDQITDPHNFGACLRTAAVMGVSAVIVPRHGSVGLTPTVAKVSVGGVESVPVIEVTNLARCLEKLKKAGVFVFGTALDDTAKPLQACDFGGKVAIIMGSEGEGMRRLTTELCDTLVYIPMTDNPNRPQSLNVSVATGMVLWEVVRQR